MLTSKQRAQLRALGTGLDTIVFVGKGGIGEALIKQADDAVSARELIKCRVLESAMLTAREAADEIAGRLGADVVQVIGSKFLLYRENKDIPKEKRIQLTK